MQPPFLLVVSPVTGDTSSGEESRLRGAGLLAGFPQHLQAPPGDEVVFVTPGVSRALVPLDCALVLQILDGVVVALTVRSDTGAFCRFEKGEVGSWYECVCPVVFGVYLLSGFEQRPPVFGHTIHHVSPATRRRATGHCPSD